MREIALRSFGGARVGRGRASDFRALITHGSLLEDCETQFIYLNHFKTARAWIDGDGGSGGFSDAMDFSSVNVDADGYPDDLPTGYTFITALWAASGYPSQMLTEYELRWTGDWDVTPAGGATLTRDKESDGNAHNIRLTFSATNCVLRFAANSTSQLGGVELVRVEDLPAFDGGAKYHDTFLSLVRRAKTRRWMKEQKIEDSAAITTADITPEGYFSYNSP